MQTFQALKCVENNARWKSYDRNFSEFVNDVLKTLHLKRSNLRKARLFSKSGDEFFEFCEIVFINDVNEIWVSIDCSPFYKYQSIECSPFCMYQQSK